MARGIQQPQDGPGPNRNGRKSQSTNVCEDQGISRRAGLSLPLNTLAIPVPFFSTPDRERVEEDGEVLFQYFVQEGLQNAGFRERVLPDQRSDAGDYARAGPSVSTPDGYKNSFLAEHGRELRRIADKFARSRENEEVRAQAQTVNLSDITREGFLDLLGALFQDGFSRDRLIALFFFCLYLIIRSITEKRDLFNGLFLWSLQYIRNNVCQWVYDHGGWGRVLTDIYEILYKALKITAISVGICVGLVYIYRSVKK